MNKNELEQELFKRSVFVLERKDGVELNPDALGRRAKEYSYRVRYRLPGSAISEERDVSIVVLNEGTDQEEALYDHGFLPDVRSDLEIMVSLSKAIDPGIIVLDSPSTGVWRVKLSNGSEKLVALNSSRNGFIDISTGVQ